MACADKNFVGGVILGLLKLGGIALWMNYHGFFKNKPTSREEKALPEVHDTKEDYFSQLPDDVLSSILTRLLIRDAVRTSILSRRWRYLFSYRPTLQFNLEMIGVHPLSHRCCPYYQRKFFKVVNQVLQLYLCRKVDCLKIRVCIGREVSSEFDQLMLFISKLSVEEIYISFACHPIPYLFRSDFDSSKLFRFPLQLFSQASLLKYLVVIFCVPQPSLGVPLNSLRTLVLMSVPFEEGQLEGILSSCLNLNQLSIEHCKFPYKICISGTVTSVSITSCNGLGEIDLRATNLRSLECCCFSEVRFYFSYVTMLENVNVSTSGDAAMPYIFGDFARDLPACVKSLRVDAWGYQVTCFPTETRIFRNLIKLALLLSDTYDFEIIKVYPVLGACPLLRYLDLVLWRTKREEKGSDTRSPLSPTYHSELKEVRFCGFHGTREETEFASYIVRSAVVLKRMFLSQYIPPEYVIHNSASNYTIWKQREVERSSIQRQLHGQAISSNAVVIIQ